MHFIHARLNADAADGMEIRSAANKPSYEDPPQKDFGEGLWKPPLAT